MTGIDIQVKIDALAETLNADILVYIGDIQREYDDYIINECRKRKLRKNVLLLLKTFGGDPNAGYRIARCLQDAYHTVKKGYSIKDEEQGNFYIYVDGICKSAGTLICLGADQIIMSENGELGPIDVQLRKQDEVGERTSGLTPIEAIKFLEIQSIQLFKRHFMALRFSDLGFSTKIAADVATQLTSGLLTPIYQQIEPYKLAEYDRSLRIAIKYGERLENGNLNDGYLEILVSKYPSHGFVIDKKEAEQIFKHVESPSLELREIGEFFRSFTEYLEGDQPFVKFVSLMPFEFPESENSDEGESLSLLKSKKAESLEASKILGSLAKGVKNER